jgi:hypothetical protein
MKRLLEPNTTLYPVPVVRVTCGGEWPVPNLKVDELRERRRTLRVKG